MADASTIAGSGLVALAVAAALDAGNAANRAVKG
jgi:hypothetical protein